MGMGFTYSRFSIPLIPRFGPFSWLRSKEQRNGICRLFLFVRSLIL